MCNALISFQVQYNSGYHTTLKSSDKQNLGIAQKIIGEKNMKFAILSQPFFTSTVHGKPSGESKSNQSQMEPIGCIWVTMNVKFI